MESSHRLHKSFPGLLSAHCYAEEVALRFWGAQYPPIIDEADGQCIQRARQFTDVQCHHDRLDQPLRWGRRRMVFVNSMSDLFHDAVDAAFIGEVFGVMAMATKHTFQVLTKRPKRMQQLLSDPEFQYAIENSAAVRRFDKSWDWPLPNVWIGVSVETQRFANERIPVLLQTPAGIRFVSYEPALGPVDFTRIPVPGSAVFTQDQPTVPALMNVFQRASVFAPHVNWVIVGGESTKKARPFDLDWARLVVAHGAEHGVPVFVKQMGECPYDGWSQGAHASPRYLKFKSKKGSNPSEWPEELRVRQFPVAA